MQHEHDFLMEKRLRALDPQLHRRFTDAVFALQLALSRYGRLFPGYTDHSQLHSMTVIDFCNVLIGSEQIEKLNADEIYVLLMSCYLHDVGMGISENDYELFKQQLDHETYFKTHPAASIPDFIRDYHHEFSALFIRKYAQLLELPSPEHLFAVVQVSRGHRRTDLFDPAEYPSEYRLPNGNTVCLPYLAALIRLADEIDVASDRNSALLFDYEALTAEDSIFHNGLLQAVPRIHTMLEGFMLDVQTDDGTIYAGLSHLCEKMQSTLQLCRAAVHERTPYRISQKWVDLRKI